VRGRGGDEARFLRVCPFTPSSTANPPSPSFPNVPCSFEDYTSVDIVSRVMEITSNVGCKAVIDGIGLSTVDISIDSLARRGIFVSFGNASGAVPAFPVLRLIGKSGFVTRPKLLDYTVDRAELVGRAEEIMGWLEEGKLNVKVDEVFGLDEAKDGHDYLEAGKSMGKVLYKC